MALGSCCSKRPSGMSEWSQTRDLKGHEPCLNGPVSQMSGQCAMLCMAWYIAPIAIAGKSAMTLRVCVACSESTRPARSLLLWTLTRPAETKGSAVCRCSPGKPAGKPLWEADFRPLQPGLPHRTSMLSACSSCFSPLQNSFQEQQEFPGVLAICCL